MKDLSTPVNTPFALSNALNNPNASGVNHYFVDSHRQESDASQPIPSRFDEVGAELLLNSIKHGHPRGSESFVDFLPNEILSLIFEFGYFDFKGEREPNDAFRSMALQTSRRFRQLAFHTPSLWSVIHLSPSNVSHELPQLPTYLERSKDYPLEIQLRSFWNTTITERVMEELLPHSKRWQRLSIVSMNNHISSFFQHISAPLLEHIYISYYSHHQRTSLPRNIFQGHLPKLSSLYLRNIDIDGLDFAFQGLSTLEIRGYGSWPTFPKLKEMLNGSLLQRLVLHVKPKDVMQQIFTGTPEGSRDVQILLPELRIIEVYTSEWLTPAISRLVSLFACPKLEDLFVRENTGSLTETPRTILHHSQILSAATSSYDESTQSSHLPYRLFLCSANLQFASQALPPATVSTLELHRAYWPRHDIANDVFTSLKNLRHLLIYDHRPSEALLQIHGSHDQPSPPSFKIPSLQTFAIEFSRTRPISPGDDVTRFIRLFFLPSLRALHLKTLNLPQWKSIAETFSRYSGEYPLLTSLTLSDISDVIPTNPHDPFYTHISTVFPHLSRLSLDGVCSNAFIQQLLPSPSAGADLSGLGAPMPLPNLRALSISNDTNVSKPLIYRAIIARKDMGVPLSILEVDSHFSGNMESWEWMREHVQVGQATSEFF